MSNEKIFMGEWECKRCGYVTNDFAPDKCPECGAVRQYFVFYAYPDATAWEDEDRFLHLEIPDIPPYSTEEEGRGQLIEAD